MLVLGAPGATFVRINAGNQDFVQIANVGGVTLSCGPGVAGGRLLSIGGEAPTGTIASVFAYTPSSRRWDRLADLPTPRHGLAVVGIGPRVYVIGGGPRPGLFVSGANESLDVRD